MRRLLSTINRRGSQESTKSDDLTGDSPEASAARGVRLFCESGGPNNSGEEVLHLPVIVEAAESSPPAAREAANRIRKFLTKDNLSRPYVQYNAIMLVRILADNPGKSFTRNLDKKFVVTVKELLRDCRDPSVQQILRETLENFETLKADDETLVPLTEMWKKEKLRNEKNGIAQLTARTPVAPAYNPNQQNYFARSHKPRGLPPPDELAQRIEEAKTSGKLLLQVVQSTPPAEIQGNELIKEFVQRCQSASRSVEGYIHSDSPPPDEDTLLTLIETNDQLSTALSRYQRALLQARRATGPFEVPGTVPARVSTYPTSFSPPPGPPPPRRQESEWQAQHRNPFDDRHATDSQHQEFMPPRIQPQNYGLPASAPMSSHADLYHAPSGYTRRQDRLRTHDPISPLDGPTSPTESRKPVEYRF